MNVRLDVFSFQIVSKYFFYKEDYINSILICHKFMCILDRFRYNPIPVNSTKLFPFMETQHIYTKEDVFIDDIEHYVVWYSVTLDEFLNDLQDRDITFKNIEFSNPNNIIQTLASISLIPNIKSLGKEFLKFFRVENFQVPNNITELKPRCFKGNSLSSVTLCDYIETIPMLCFSECLHLIEVVIPTSVKSYDMMAFSSCGLTAFTIPDHVIYIGDRCFERCLNLVHISIGRGIQVIPDSAFSFCENVTFIDLPDTIKVIKSSAFFNCRNLENLKIPKSVLKVGNAAFCSCKSLKELVFPENCELVASTFVLCSNLTKFVVPTINNKVRHVISFEEISIYEKFYENFESSNNYYNLFDTNNEFVNDQKITELSVFEDESFDKLGDVGFIPENYKTVKNVSFFNCEQIKSFYFCESVTQLKKVGFYYCTNLEYVVMSSSVEKLCDFMFNNCINLKCIKNMNNIKHVGKKCFENCESLQELKINQNATIGFRNFENCISLTKLEVPNYKNKILFDVTFKEINTFQKFGYECDKIVFIFDKNMSISDFEKITDKNKLYSFGGVYSTHQDLNVKIPNNVTRIMKNFFDIKNLESLDLGIVKELGNQSIRCDVHSLTIPTTLTKLGNNNFVKCKNLSSINLCGKHCFTLPLNKTEKGIFEKCGIHCDCTIFGDREFEQYGFIPKNFKFIKLVFESNKTFQLQKFVVPNEIISIKKSCFTHCYNLQNVILSNSLTEIADYAFADCFSLVSITLPQTLKIIGKHAFSSCVNLVQIDIPKSVEYIGDNAFSICTQISSVTTPDTVFSSKKVFKKCYSLSSISIIENKKETCQVYNSTFCQCTKLTEIFFPKCVTEICSNGCCELLFLQELSLPERLIKIGKSAFENCTSLSRIHLGEKLEEIGAFCFCNCVSLQTIEIPKSVTLLGFCSFKDCNNLKQVEIHNNIQKCSQNAFEGCKNITEVLFDNKTITQIKIPVTYEIYLNFKKNKIQCTDVFFTRKDVKRHLEFIKKDEKLIGKVPDNVVGLSDNCFRGYKTTQLLEIPKNVKSFGAFCFYNSVPKENVLFENKMDSIFDTNNHNFN
ncbi:hypothetical protein EIN_201590 [Entamoeba invadens IP1]|uniref:Leucine rich repeat containing protein BspA family protein n=1 Tax=Entamoeba invadens IP1 TaxID=370355 RepID=A0A0A1U5N5_ENTIV|nr:hypothetical protein EIN_201590 [Entamoeba invadens IP1]ELP89634.1 hypothetical protein EIN_201590 [Entamoeba invadens IP1]|eukprot:XP_004256405.1 hypothetical protein EIN_201590 [Entamoeba invadens IP1]